MIYLFEKYISNVEDTRIATKVDLNNRDIRLKEDVLYEFLGIRFTIKYSSSLDLYSTILNSPDDSKFDEVVYAKSMDSLVNKIRFNIKELIEDYGIEDKYEKIELESPIDTNEFINVKHPLENELIDINDTLYFYMSVDTGDIIAIKDKENIIDKKDYKFIISNIDKGIFKYKDSVSVKSLTNISKLKEDTTFKLYTTINL